MTIDYCDVTLLYVLDGVHIGTTWRIRLNDHCAGAMWPFVKLLLPSVLLLGRITCTKCKDMRPIVADIPWSVIFLLDITMCCAKTEGPIAVLFRAWTQVDAWNRVFGGGPDFPRGRNSLGAPPAMRPFVKVLSSHLLDFLNRPV